MQSVYDLAWILPHVRESLRGVGNMNFDAYVDGLFRVLEALGVPSYSEVPTELHRSHL